MRRLPLVLSFLLCAPLAADPFPTQERGFQAERAFYVGDFDTVNLFNGNLVLTIPIGGSYPVGAGLSYGLTLAYNSNVWDFQEDAFGIYRQALPNRRSNAGLGWRLSLGELLDPAYAENDIGLWTYVGADGGEHSFRNTLIQAGFGAILDFIYLAQNTKHQANVARGNLAQALAHLEKIGAAGGPGRDPDFKHHQKEIKTFLENAKRAAEKLPGKLREAYLKSIEAIAGRAGLSV